MLAKMGRFAVSKTVLSRDVPKKDAVRVHFACRYVLLLKERAELFLEGVLIVGGAAES